MPKTRTVASFNDMKWLYDRLDHLLTVFDEGCMGDSSFTGPNETMAAVRDCMPYYIKKYGLVRCWPKGRSGASKAPVHLNQITGVLDSKGKMIRDGDILSIIHLSENFPTVEFRRLVSWSDERGAFVLVYPRQDATTVEYLGEMKNDPNFVSCSVYGIHHNLLNILQGYPRGWTQAKVDKLFAKGTKARRMRG